jgi:acyl carrier protein
MQDYHKGIRDFIFSNLVFDDSAGLENDTSFLESGIIDSTGFLELIMFMESNYAIKVAPEEMIPGNLDSVNRAAQFLKRKLGEATA